MSNCFPSLESSLEEAVWSCSTIPHQWQQVLDNLQTLFLLQTMLQPFERLNPNDSPINENSSMLYPKLIVPEWEGPWHCSYRQVIGDLEPVAAPSAGCGDFFRVEPA
jgi:hypothetical protein